MIHRSSQPSLPRKSGPTGKGGPVNQGEKRQRGPVNSKPKRPKVLPDPTTAENGPPVPPLQRAPEAPFKS